MGSKDSPSVVTGFKYMMGVHLIACHGPVDSVNKIIIGEREAWSGTQTASGTITINKPDLFGGDGREGGVVGDVDILMGEGTQPRNTYLAAQQGPNCSAYRGLLSLVFKQFQWASGNPYFKSPWLEVTRVLAGWGDNGVWNAADAKIGTLDMNPAHMIYQAMTHPAWGMGYSPSDMNDAVMRACATKLKNENFGLSLEWDTQTSIEDFVANILEHISGSMGVNLSTGKFELKLIRDDYNINDLLELNESNILELRSFQRAAYGDSANEVVVTYTDRDQNDKTIAVQDVASIAAQGAVISVTRNYPGIREASLAARVAMRDLKTLSTPLAKVNLTTNRVTWDKEKGDVVRLNWPDLQISGAAFRIIDIDKGTLTNGAINVTLVEDIFGLPDNAYSAAPISQWVDTVVPPIAVDAGKAFEVPYYEIVRSTSLANQATLPPDYGFGFFMASRGAVRSALNYVLASSPDNTTYSNAGVGHFSPAGSLVAPITEIQETITLTGAFDLDEAVLSADGGYAYIGNECVSVISVAPSTGVVTVKRGILDTVPAAHAAGVKVFFYARDAVARDSAEHTAGETVYYKPRPTTGTGTLALDDAQSVMLVMSNRASRPYPPGQFKVDGQYYPSSIAGPGVSISWAHRDRIAQTAGYIDYSAGNIGPEIGTTYRVRVYNGATLLRTYDLDATTTSWSYPADDDTADGNQGVLRVTLNSVRDGLESLQAHDHTFNRIAASGSVTVGGVPAAPVLTAADASFAVDLSWVFGNARTDMKHVEIRVATEPDLSHSDVLEYVDYPGLTKTHSLGIANSFRWYWCRVIDTSGSISPWSNMVSGRGVTSAMTASDILTAIQGQVSTSALTATLASKVGLIDTIQQDMTVVKNVVDGVVNLLPNAGFDTDTYGWDLGWNQIVGDPVGVVVRNLGEPTWKPTTANTIGMYRLGDSTGIQDFGVGGYPYYGGQVSIPNMVPGKRYCISGYLAAHRCSVQIVLVFIDDSFTQLATFQTSWAGQNSGGSSGGDNLADWDKRYVFGVCPLGATRALIAVRQSAGNNQPYCWIAEPMLEEATATQTVPSTWTSKGQGLSAQYSLKINNRGYVTGFGLLSTEVDDIPTSEFVVLADSFRIGAPDGVKIPFAVTQVSPGVWKTLLNSDVVIGGNVDISNLTTGSLPTDVTMRLGGGTIELDGAGEIRVFKDLNPNPDFVKLSAGEIRFLKYVSGVYQTYNYLSRMETGIANNNDTVVIPGYWKAQPRVIVSPASLGLYKAANSAQDQSVDCQALSLQETFTGSGVWQFNARATLNLAAGTSVTAINATSGDLTATTTWNSGTYVTPTNCSNITPTVNLTSMRWTAGTTYQNRSVNWRVRYTGDGGGGAWRTKDLSGIVTSVVDSYTFNFPAAGQYSFWIEFSASDVAGTFIASGASYESTTASINGTGAASNSGIRRTITMPAYSPPVGWQISSVNWSYNVGWYIMGGFIVRSGLGIAAGPPGPGVTLNNQGGNTASALSMTTYTSVQPTYDNTQCWIEAYDTKGGAWGGGSSIYTGFGATGTASAVVTLRRYLGYTASGQNRFDFASYGYTLASASVLATGTLNWLAVGE